MRQFQSFPRSALKSFCALIVALSVPVILTIGSIRLLMTPAYLTLEYNKPDFPIDPYGLTLADRLHYAPYAVHYLTSSAPIKLLSDLTFSNGNAFYNPRELEHMIDVQHVTMVAFAVCIGFALLFLLIALWKTRSAQGRRWLRLNLIWGASFTLILIALLAIGVFIAWDTFFTGFHEVFFSSGTWVFNYSDSLIRLFPVRFWQDAALTIGGVVALGALIIIALCWTWSRRALRQPPARNVTGTLPQSSEGSVRSW